MEEGGKPKELLCDFIQETWYLQIVIFKAKSRKNLMFKITVELLIPSTLTPAILEPLVTHCVTRGSKMAGVNVDGMRSSLAVFRSLIHLHVYE